MFWMSYKGDEAHNGEENEGSGKTGNTEKQQQEASAVHERAHKR